jgi:hypothetical protein
MNFVRKKGKKGKKWKEDDVCDNSNSDADFPPPLFGCRFTFWILLRAGK